jgi:protein-S-isoprenylcysteine O-methyltransferase Ste14
MKYSFFSRHKGNFPLALDVIERVVAATFFSFFALRFLSVYISTGAHVYLLLVFSECLVIGFFLFRRFTNEVSLNPIDWLVAVIGTTLPLLAVAGGDPLVPNIISGVLMLFGIAGNIWAKLSLRRSFGIVAANRGIKTRGPYGLIRHPMYFAYVITQIGFLLSNSTLWNVAIYTSCLTLQVFRIVAEERVLLKDLKYQSYAQTVRYRLIPGLF